MTTANPTGIRPLPRCCAVYAAASGAVATAMGAIGSHWVEAHASERFASAFQTATGFALWHALALAGLSWTIQQSPTSRLLPAAAGCWMAGILLFCGSLWLRGVGVDPRVVAIAPLGGALLIVGWVLVTLAVLRIPGRS